MAFPVFRRLFIGFGLIHCVYNAKLNRFIPSLRLTVYGALISLAIQLFSALSFYVRRMYILQALLTINPLSVMANIIVAFDCTMWIIMIGTPVLTVFSKQKSIRRILNHILKYDQKYLRDSKDMADNIFQSRMSKIAKIFGVFVSFGNLFVSLFNYGLKPIALFTIVSHCIMTTQFVLGHSYELMFFEKLQLNYWILEQTTTNGHKIKSCIKQHSKLMHLTKKAANVFGPNKIICLASLTILISVYWFYTYDHIKSVVPTFVWQMILSVIFVVCHSWDRMSSKVSAMS